MDTADQQLSTTVTTAEHIVAADSFIPTIVDFEDLLVDSGRLIQMVKMT